EATWPGPLPAARTQPLSEIMVREQLGRLGETPFELGAIVLELPRPVMAPRSVLNDLRRKLVAELMERRKPRYEICDGASALELLPVGSTRQDQPARPFIVGPDVLASTSPGTRRLAKPGREGEETTGPWLHVLVRNVEQLDAVLALKPATVYCEFED